MGPDGGVANYRTYMKCSTQSWDNARITAGVEPRCEAHQQIRRFEFAKLTQISARCAPMNM